ncbi:glycoside hydrolase family 2 protein [Artomyces pyxidatus]|uniref:Glycoside hydrolase family 2 protein n=1 Tax=Artomyces pyxidatus TaxID=48021 RepID=A0ACB8TC00_9AGAM|nr:glycoside hydrolase family 2 protein [Artomyces pyxidatus]
MGRFFGVALLAGLLPALARASVFSLSELPWSLKNQNGSIVVPGSVPSQAHLDLLKAGVITEPLLGINEFTERWIVNDNWTYTADISSFVKTLPKSSTQKTLLVFYGIDTIANITLAGHPIAWVNNQFQQYVFDVSDAIASPLGKNTNLTLSFESAWYYGLNASTRPDAESFPAVGVDFEYVGVRNWIRKVQSDFGWDWGPAFVPSGIHKPAYFITLSETTSAEASDAQSINTPILVSQSSIDIFKQGYAAVTGVAPNQAAPWIVNVSLAVHSVVAAPRPSLTLSIPELKLSSKPISLHALPGPGKGSNASISSPTWVTAQWSIPDSIPERWFPHNLGTPKLYNLSLTLDLGGAGQSFTFQTSVGFRTIQLMQTRYPDAEVAARGITPGDQWHFEVNGKAFYSLGTNIIPFDPFYARISDEQVRWVIQSAVQSGQNMLRVWGGGVYQPSTTSVALTANFPQHATDVYSFYSVCDELGILAWSEFIFSDDFYPLNDWLIDSVNEEVVQNVRRINKHASTAQWAGGNEIEGIVQQVAEDGFPGSTHYLDEFVTLFQDDLHDVAYSATNSVPYTDCSTTHGVLSVDPLIIRFGNATPGEIYGNSERYDYSAPDAFTISTFPVSRFVNEFGFHSMPSFYSWEEVLQSPDDFSFNSEVVMSRDHHPPAGSLAWPNPNAIQGQEQMSDAVELWLPTPGTSDSNQTFAQWCWSTQVFQAMTMYSQLAFYRLGAGRPENNLGALVWQLNDIWQGVSWSSIEYSGRWKVLHYVESTIFQPVVINPFWTAASETLEIAVTSDRWESVSGQAQWTWFNWEGKALNTTHKTFTVPTLNNSILYQEVGLSNILPNGTAATDVWLHMNLTAHVGQETVTNEQFFTPASLANATLVDPRIEVTHGPGLTFTLSAKGGVAPWTWLDHPSGTVGFFADKTGHPLNGFYLVPGADRTVTFQLNAALSRVKTPNPSDFVVRSLWNNTHV